MRFQIRDADAGLCFIEAATAEEALSIFLTNTLRGMEKCSTEPMSSATRRTASPPT
jgi:hypothetical protein